MNLEDKFGGERSVRVDELGAGSGKRVIDIARWHTRAALHRDPVTLRHKLLDRLWRGGDSRLVRPRFGRHSDMQAVQARCSGVNASVWRDTNSCTLVAG